jgi:hypothetical protein
MDSFFSTDTQSVQTGTGVTPWGARLTGGSVSGNTNNKARTRRALLFFGT